MTTCLDNIHTTIIEIDNTIALTAIACIPVVGTIVQAVKESYLFSAIKHSPNLGKSLELLQEKNKVSKIFTAGLAVQAIITFAIAIFAGAGFYALATLIPFGLLIGYNISKIQYNGESIENLEKGGIFVPRIM